MTMIQVRNVPEDVHRLLKSRAARRGMSLSDYLLNEIFEHVAHSTLDDALGAMRGEPEIRARPDAADIIRATRDRP